VTTSEIRIINPGQGNARVQKFIDGARLQQVVASRPHADRLLKQARNHLLSSSKLATDDPEGAYSALYDAARKALVAVLEVQGLRPTTKGGHFIICEALAVQIEPPFDDVISPFNRMRKMRNSHEYPNLDQPELSTADVLEDLEKAKRIVEIAHHLLDQFPVFNA
jgi:HEPN domain